MGLPAAILVGTGSAEQKMEDLGAFLQQAKDRKQALANKESQPVSNPGDSQIDRARTLVLGEWVWHTLQIRVMGESYLGK